MSDEPTASITDEPTNQAGDANDPNRAVTLARAALQARVTERQRRDAEHLAKTTETIASIKALLLNTWDTLGIDPDSFTTDDRGRPTWRGSVSLTDPADRNEPPTQVTLETSVSLSDNSLYFRAGTASLNAYARTNGSQLPETPPSDQAIGDLLLNGWLEALQNMQRKRLELLDSLLNHAQEIVNGYNRATEENLRNLAIRIGALKPGDLPDPYQESLAKVKAKLSKARQCVEAKLQDNADYTAAATRVKLTAAKWVRRYAAWDDECNSLARTLTEHHFKPFIVYEIRYTAIGAPPAIVDEDGNVAMAAEEIYTMQSPLEIANEGRAIMVNAIDYNGNPSVVIIGAFLDGRTKLDAKTPPATTAAARFYHTRRIGQSDYYANFTPTMSKATVEEIMGMISFPMPPTSFAEAVLTEMHIKIADYNYLDATSWADIDPKTLRTDVLELAQKPKQQDGSEEEEKEAEIPF